jgi:hypothetical protein
VLELVRGINPVGLLAHLLARDGSASPMLSCLRYPAAR